MEPERERWLNDLAYIRGLVEAGKAKRWLHEPVRISLAFAMRGLGVHRELTADTFFGLPMRIPFPESNDIFIFGAKPHPSELKLAAYLIRREGELKCFFDVGAHLGYYSLLVSVLYPNAEIRAFEPSTLYSYLCRNAAGRSGIRPYQVALGKEVGSMEFWEFPLGRKESNSAKPPAAGQEGGAMRKTVQATTVDAIVSEEGLMPDLMKIDVEGLEYEVLQGALHCLQRGVELIMEFHPGDFDRGSLYSWSYLQDMGYMAYDIREDGSLVEVSPRELRGLDSVNIVFKRE